MNKRIGIYGGTFDPVHFGHLNTAIEIMEYHQLDEVWFCPAHINPHKLGTSNTSPQHRLNMLELALKGLSNFSIKENELQREGPSYTIDTLRELKAEEKKHKRRSQFFLIIGEDSIPHFLIWHEPKEIIKLASPLIARRSVSEPPSELSGDPEICQALSKGLTPTRLMEISATQVRERVNKGLYIGHLVPAKVIDYIYQNHLYYNPYERVKNS